jgi:hypothetical protein
MYQHWHISHNWAKRPNGQQDVFEWIQHRNQNNSELNRTGMWIQHGNQNTSELPTDAPPMADYISRTGARTPTTSCNHIANQERNTTKLRQDAQEYDKEGSRELTREETDQERKRVHIISSSRSRGGIERGRDRARVEDGDN